MMSGRHGPAGVNNRLLLALPSAVLQRLWPKLEEVALSRGQIIGHVGRTVERVYFVNRGLVSLVKTMRDGRTVEIGAIGVEGVTDANTLFGLDTTFLEAVVQVPGSALLARTDLLREMLRTEHVLRHLMQRYVALTIHQLAQTAACNRLHSLEERCCRWLLIAHDSALSDSFSLTHEFLAMMLGVQRSGVSIAANALRSAGLIRYTHGVVTVTDRPGLEHAACECHRTVAAEIAALFRVAG